MPRHFAATARLVRLSPPERAWLRLATLGSGTLARRLALAMLALGTAACAAGEPVIWVEKGVSFSSYRAVQLGAVANETGQSTNQEVAQSLTDRIRAKLTAHGVRLAEDGSAADGMLVLEARLTAYSPGNAAARWLAPGAGTTQCIVEGELLDGRTESAGHREVWHDTIISRGVWDGRPGPEGVSGAARKSLAASARRSLSELLENLSEQIR